MGKHLLTMKQHKEKLEREAKYNAAREKYVTSPVKPPYAELAVDCGVSVSAIAKIGARDKWVLARKNYWKPNKPTIDFLRTKYNKTNCTKGSSKGGGNGGGDVRGGQEEGGGGMTTRTEMDVEVVELAFAQACVGGDVKPYLDARRLELAKEDREGGDVTPKLVIVNRTVDAAIGGLSMALVAIGRSLQLPDKSIEPVVTPEEAK